MKRDGTTPNQQGNSTMLSRRRFIAYAGGVLGGALLVGCRKREQEAPADAAEDEHPTSIEVDGIDYLVLVNKQHMLPDG